jgi:predicted acyltransferase
MTVDLKPLSKRLLSIDVFRAITMLLMIFVNDVGSVKNIPEWIDHVKADEDGLGFADVIFPAFLFIVGLSLPLAIKKRIKKGDNLFNLISYILIRSLALLVMGFFHVNSENYSTAAWLPYSVWMLLLTLSFFLIWLDYPDNMFKAKKYAFINAGIVLLLLLAWLYKGGTPQSPEGLKPHWWGILGIIGWSYLVCATVYLFLKYNFLLVVIAFVAFLTVNILSHSHLMPFEIWVIGDASSVSLTMAGIVISVVYGMLVSRSDKKLLWLVLTLSGITTISLGLLIRPYTEGISKIHSTPAWVLICTGISILVFELVIYLVDIKGKPNWFKAIRPAGTSTLTCYLIPYFLYSLLAIANIQYPQFLTSGFAGIIKSFAIAFFVIWLAGLLERMKIRLRI